MSKLSRAARITKLAHAIRDYRGRLNASTGKWVQHPKASRRAHCEKWCRELGLDVEKSMKFIDKCYHWKKMRVWLGRLT